jgi:hypothetical protein
VLTTVNEGGTMEFVLTVRRRIGSSPLKLYYEIGGPGIESTDFSHLSGRVALKERSSILKIDVQSDATTEGAENASVIFASKGLRSLSEFQININDTSQAPASPPTSPPNPPSPTPEICFQFENDLGALYAETDANLNPVVKAIKPETLKGKTYLSAVIGTALDSFEGELVGTDQNDIIIGGAGQDHLFGGAGADIFYIRKEPNDTGSIIYDFNASEGDLILLDSDLYNSAGLRNAAVGAIDSGKPKRVVPRPRKATDSPGLTGNWTNLYIPASADQTVFNSDEVFATVLNVDPVGSNSIIFSC